MSRKPNSSPCGSDAHCRWLIVGLMLLAGALCGVADNTAHAAEAQWIWSPDQANGSIPQRSCYFRKSFTVAAPERGIIEIACDDTYELFLNGRSIGNGGSWEKMDRYDIGRMLQSGQNTIAVVVNNTRGGTAGLAARVIVKSRGGPEVAFSTDRSWKTSLGVLPFWQSTRYSDARWDAAQVFGPMGRTAPWVVAAAPQGEQPAQPELPSRYRINEEFQVQMVLEPEKTGSVIAMAFNEFAQIIASQENGPLLLCRDTNRDAIVDDVAVYCDKVKNCQGILPVNGDVLVIGDGPDGAALYHLSDKDRDGKLEDFKTLLKFKTEIGEHGPHGLALGPDGLVYIIVGNHAQLDVEPAASGPYHDAYEGDLVGPRYEDPGGHAVGIKAPGGTVLRTSMSGGPVEVVAGGIRNAYDLAFDDHGELFTFDSDMEWDEGTPWYRPARLNHVIDGAELGWRSGWAKWPEYFVDSLPATLNVGRGSPTGMAAYHHFMYPQKYHNAMFLGDWSEGRILAVRLTRDGATYKATSEVFLEGDPLNVTDLEVGPDGWLYFCTGGRDTEGGIYRVVWNGTVPDAVRNLGEGISIAIRQPQPESAWGRQRIARIQQDLGPKWEEMITGVATSKRNPSYYRTRAMDIMQLFGPLPSTEMLIELSADASDDVRAKAVNQLGLREADASVALRLADMLADPSPRVRSAVCRALVRSGSTASPEKVLPLLASKDRYEAFAARRLLERLPMDQWRDEVLASDDPRVFELGSLALLTMAPNKINAEAVLTRCEHWLDRYMNDTDFIDLLRVIQVALIRGPIAPHETGDLPQRMAEEFPSRDSTMNRELVRLLIYLEVDEIMDRYVEFLSSDQPAMDRLQLALYMRFLENGWTPESKQAVLTYYEQALAMPGGESFHRYVQNVSRDFAMRLTEDEARHILASGAKMPNAALVALYQLPTHPDDETLEQLKQLDRQIADNQTESTKRLQIGIVAILARHGDDDSMQYLRDIFDRDPERRSSVAMGLAQQPNEANWPFLVRSLPVVEGAAAQEVLIKLKSIPLAPEAPESYRQVILRGLKLKESGGKHAVALLEHWTGKQVGEPDAEIGDALTAWQAWFATTYPQQPPAELPVESDTNNWAYDDLVEFLLGDEAPQGSPIRGAAVYVKAQCAKCHRFGGAGEGLGPDLTSVARRFQKKEILQSILFPSHVISDQYAAKTIITADGRQITGIVSPGPAGQVIVLTSDGTKVALGEDDVDEVAPSRVSAMPEGLLNNLTLEEITDLFTYLTTPPAPTVTRQPDATTPK